MPVVYLWLAALGAWTVMLIGLVVCAMVLVRGLAAARMLRQQLRHILCRHRYQYVRHLYGSGCIRLLHCPKCKGYFEQNVGIPGAPIAPALEENLPPRARLP